MFAQNADSKVRYSIDLVRTDSFFLSEQTIRKGKDRPDTLVRYTLFRDTSEFRAYIVEQVQAGENARLQMEYFKTEFDSLDGRVKRLAKLGKDVFGLALKPDKRDVVQINELEVMPPGFWVIYPYRGRASAEYITDLTQIKKDALILNQNGTTFEFKPPKKPIKRSKNK